jgi:hypothetical protein
MIIIALRGLDRKKLHTLSQIRLNYSLTQFNSTKTIIKFKAVNAKLVLERPNAC